MTAHPDPRALADRLDPRKRQFYKPTPDGQDRYWVADTDLIAAADYIRSHPAASADSVVVPTEYEICQNVPHEEWERAKSGPIYQQGDIKPIWILEREMLTGKFRRAAATPPAPSAPARDVAGMVERLRKLAPAGRDFRTTEIHDAIHEAAAMLAALEAENAALRSPTVPADLAGLCERLASLDWSPKDGERARDPVYLCHEALEAISALEGENRRLRSEVQHVMGVGDGSGQLFVHGDYESIKAAQAIVDRCESLSRRVAELEGENANMAALVAEDGRLCRENAELSERAEVAERVGIERAAKVADGYRDKWSSAAGFGGHSAAARIITAEISSLTPIDRPAMALIPRETLSRLRCVASQNPVGTDTYAEGYECPCVPCEIWRRVKS